MKRDVVIGLCLVGMLAASCATGGQAVNDFSDFRSEDDGIFSLKVGQFMVYTLIDAQREGNAGILVDADAAVLERFIPEAGFSHSTNAFLIKTPQGNILVDNGFGATIIDKMQKLDITPEQISAVLITHLHGDHIGGLQKDGAAIFPNAKIYVSKNEHEHFTQTQPNQGAVAALAPYEVITFEPAQLQAKHTEILPGIFPIANYGHTPGHTVFMVESGKEKLIIAGDFLHVALVQFAVPDISASFDMDKEAAAVSRKQILDYAAQNKIPIGAMHIVYPGIGAIGVSSDEGVQFTFTPVK
ncbi:MAG: MBL fold metallo-hydrolase [Treponema sp.]|jgi:glyoxylase-like metal-dependent hydrolase (beta-lactamase superfamily II)|nr:MBL fold metallo-hydrolase [Treponema sp.]